MKKLLFLLLSTIILTGCNIEDDGPRINYQLAKVTAADLPEEFEKGKVYEIDITYLLPSACHTAAGIEAKRGDIAGEGRRKIYVAGVASFDANITECDEEEDEDELLEESSFSLRIDEDDPYTFYLWTSYNDNLESVYTTVEVPVVAPQSSSGD